MRIRLPSTSVLCFLLSFFATTGVQAQIKQGDLRLSLDVTFLSYRYEREEGVRNEREKIVEKTSDFQLGPGAGDLEAAGIGVAYAVTPFVLPSLYASFRHSRYDMTAELNGDENQNPYGAAGTTNFIQVRPGLEVPFLPGSQIIPFALAACAIATDGDRFGFGPMLGGGLHGFVGTHISFDAQLVFRRFFQPMSSGGSSYGELSVDTRSEYSALLSAGVSLWI